jgi:hypothetical protein
MEKIWAKVFSDRLVFGGGHVYPKNGHSEPAAAGAPWKMNGKWSGNSFLLASSPLANHGG